MRRVFPLLAALLLSFPRAFAAPSGPDATWRVVADRYQAPASTPRSIAGHDLGITASEPVELTLRDALSLALQRNPELGPAQPRHSWRERMTTLAGIWPVAAIFLIVFGGIYGGVFTPTEGAAVGAVATFVAGLAMRELDFEGIKRSFLATAETSGMIFMIFVGADMLNSALALSQLPAQLAQQVAGLGLPPLMIVVGILLFYIVLGSVMDELSMILLTIPVLFPTVMGLDLYGLAPTDKAIWFGILVLMVVEIGLIAPPVGLNVYVVNGMARDVPMSETYRGVFPFLVSDAIRVALLVLFPPLSLWLVHLLT